MKREAGPHSHSHRTIGLSLALGATFGAVVGAALGAVSGEFGHWMGMGIPFGISVGLAAGAMFSKPARRERESGIPTTPWMASDDDDAPAVTRSRVDPPAA